MALVLQILIVAAAGVAAIAPMSPVWIERVYSRGLYLDLQAWLTPATNAIPVAVLDVAGLVTGVCLLAVVTVRLVLASGWRLFALLRLVWQAFVIGAVGYLVFLAMWGLNYRREPLASKLEFDQRRVTQHALSTLAAGSVDQLNMLYRAASAAPGWPPLDGMVNSLGPAFEKAQRRLQARVAVPGEPKWSLLTLYFEHAAVDGMTDPFFLEILVRHDLLPFERPFVVAHEWAHLAGYAEESEANFMGWLTCMEGRARAKYSGWIFLYGQVASDLSQPDRMRLAQRLEPGPRADLQSLYDKYQRQTLPIARDASRVVYDRFLKANRVGAGIESYDAVVRLILGTEFRGKFVPVIRAR